MSTEGQDVLHDRAVVWLQGYLRTLRHRAARSGSGVVDPVEEAAIEGRLLAAEYVGAISPGESKVWRERLREAATWEEPLYPPLPPEARDRVTTHLEALAAPVAPEAMQASTACFSAIAAYEKTGVLSANDALAWRERLRARMGLEPERPPRCSQRTLLRVVAGPALRLHQLRITSVELYDDGVVLRWHRARPWRDGPETARIWNDHDMEMDGVDDLTPRNLEDDLGTRYLGGGDATLGIKGGGWVVRFGTSQYTPAVPTTAQRLRVALIDSCIEIELTT